MKKVSNSLEQQDINYNKNNFQSINLEAPTLCLPGIYLHVWLQH